jgi:predicted ATPase/DNA-binding CsgD family transcriptional regulator/Tfp pilus assembly protein PilF
LDDCTKKDIIVLSMNAVDKHPIRTVTGSLDPKKLNALAASVPTNLPTRHGRIIGREKEMQSIQQWLRYDGVRLVTLTGFGGAGKTTLALHTARTMLELFSGGLFFIDLSLVTNPDHILSAIAKTLNLQEEPQREVGETLKDFLVNRSILFVLDNFEQVVSGAPVIAEFLETNPHVRLLVTSREALRLRGEQVLPITPLADDESAQMFVQYAQTLNPDFRLTEDNTPAITELCKKLDGLPLAIELAAMRTRMFTPQALLTRLQSDLEVDSPLLATLTSGPRDLPARQQTMRATIAWSYSLLNETEQRTFRAASMFQGGFSLHGLRAVVGLTEAETLDVVSSLVDKSLIQGHESDFGSVWFSMLGVIREFAAEQVHHLAEGEHLARALIEYYLAFSKQAAAGLKSNEQAEWFSRMDAEHPNLMGAIDLALSMQAGSEPWKMGYAIFEPMHLYWMMSGYFHLGGQAVQRGRDALEMYAEGLKPDKKIKEMLRLKGIIYSLSGSLAWSGGNYTQARDWHEAAYAIYETLNDDAGMADALNNRGVNLSILGEQEKALADYEKGLALYAKRGDSWGEMRLINNMAGSLINLKRLEETFQLYERGLSLARASGNKFFVSAFLLNAGDLEFRTGKFQAAIARLDQSIEISLGLKSGYLASWARMRLAMAHAGLGRKEMATSLLRDVYASSGSQFDADLKRIMLEAIASVLALFQKYEQALIMLGCWQSYSQQSGKYQDPFEGEAAARLAKSILRQYNREKYETSLARGAAMPINDALIYGMTELEATKEQPQKDEVDNLFTSRERDVLTLLALGKTNEEISQQLVVVMKTVEKHVANILRKLGVKNRTEAAAWAVEHGVK